jgi:hypothetical protein
MAPQVAEPDLLDRIHIMGCRVMGCRVDRPRLVGICPTGVEVADRRRMASGLRREGGDQRFVVLQRATAAARDAVNSPHATSRLEHPARWRIPAAPNCRRAEASGRRYILVVSGYRGARRRRGCARLCTPWAIDTQRRLSHRPTATVCWSPPGVAFAKHGPSTWDCPSPTASFPALPLPRGTGGSNLSSSSSESANAHRPGELGGLSALDVAIRSQPLARAAAGGPNGRHMT